MKRILFLIHDLGRGGAEKVLVNLVNNIDKKDFHVTVISLFGGGVNEQFLHNDVEYKTIFSKMFRGNVTVMKLLSPRMLHKLFIKEKYDVEISFLEGPSARIISGCQDKDTKLVSWIHVEQHTVEAASASFRNQVEAEKCYSRFDKIIGVSQSVCNDFISIFGHKEKCSVLYNVVEYNTILNQSKERVQVIQDDNRFKMIAVGTLKKSKGYLRLLEIVKELRDEGHIFCLYILGTGPLEGQLKKYVRENVLEDSVVFLGYDTNPYKYMEKCDLFVCASHSEGFSTAATESLIVGTPVCTVNVSGMKEMLGVNNDYGIVTENDKNALYEGIKGFLCNSNMANFYKEKSKERGKMFNMRETVGAVENMLMEI